MIANTTIRAISRTGAKRAMSDTPGPKMHKAKDAWKTIHATRPVDPHPHVSTVLVSSSPVRISVHPFIFHWSGLMKLNGIQYFDDEIIVYCLFPINVFQVVSQFGGSFRAHENSITWIFTNTNLNLLFFH
jgi:hypothetical protein